MNYARFEELQGIPLDLYVSDTIKRGDLDESIFSYFFQKKDNLDNAHLEMLILLLEKLGSPAAYSEIATFFRHPIKSVRYQALQAINNAISLDENAMAKVIDILVHQPYPADIIKLDSVLDRGSTPAAKELAARFLAERRRSTDFSE